jgi:hypothetical protein
MKWLGRIAAGLLVALGLIAIAQDLPSLIRGPSGLMDLAGVGALIGVLLVLLGVVALLDDRYGTAAPGIRRAGVAATAVTGLIVLRMLTFGEVSVEGSLVAVALVVLLASEITGGRAGRKPRSVPEDAGTVG